ncbi:MAG TPA: antibiotic biosynthesis monooxygenase, partial [Phenylobacterium sp.]|nr:antibiotic biosynthesis monooxygenase [Phenylobacterium sp.]
MIGVVATLKVQDGKGGEFEQVFKDLMAQVKANEPGCLAYQPTKSRT